MIAFMVFVGVACIVIGLGVIGYQSGWYKQLPQLFKRNPQGTPPTGSSSSPGAPAGSDPKK